MRRLLEQAFSPERLEIVDESHLHEGHAGARDGKGHYSVTIVSSRFHGARALDSHRMVFAALGEMMQTDIHALRVNTSAPDRRATGQRTEDFDQ